MMLRLPLLTALLLLPAVAAAQSVDGLYISGETGVNFAGSPTSAHDTTKVDTDPGPLGVVALGWGFGNGLRAEIEGSYRSNDVDGISTRRGNGLMEPLTNAGGTLATSAVMANVVYDIPVRDLGLPVQPYVGAGLGYGWLQFNDVGGNGRAQFPVPGASVVSSPDAVRFGDAGAFAYQAIAGLSVPLPILHNLDATLEYRFFGTARADIPVTRVATGGNTVNGVTPSLSTRNGFEGHNDALLVGLRYSFGTL
jgi:opacity protein-like surface antigen